MKRMEMGNEIIILRRPEILMGEMESLCSGERIDGEDFKLLRELRIGEEHYILIVYYRETDREVSAMDLAVGSTDGVTYKVEVKQKFRRPLVIRNLSSCLEWEGRSREDVVIYGGEIERSKDVYEYLRILEKVPYEHEHDFQTEYPALDLEEHQHALSQKNQYCRRLYDMEPVGGRGEFQRDYDRIIHSKSFRRMVDKAQIFSAVKGDYYRTRMTHTLTVIQIAKGISNPLKLNLYLTEAIAAGHDLGHTPFGHQGERTLDAILRGDIGLLPQGECEQGIYGGFKHNYQTLREVTALEETYIQYKGLNLSYQTLEGMWKHTGTSEKFRLSEFFPEEMKQYLHPEYKFCTNLEGQVVAIADEIAQRGHDLDDAFAAGVITLDDLKHYLELNRMSSLLKILRKNDDVYQDYKEKNCIHASPEELRQNRAVSEVIRFFIEDVVKTSGTAIDAYGAETFERDGHIVRDVVIKFSDCGLALCRYLEKIITKKVINCPEVALFDSKAEQIVKSLFIAYYQNPQLLHRGTIRRIFGDFRRVTENVIDFENGDNVLVKEEWMKITGRRACLPGEKDEYREKRKILVRNICDFVAGMTDSYARREYHKIYD